MSSVDDEQTGLALSNPAKTARRGEDERENDTGEEKPPPPKRARLQIACTRCRTRKQKCDGGQPKCGTCVPLATECEYIAPSKSRPYDKYEYVKALEWKVGEYETLLAHEGARLSEAGQEHLRALQSVDPWADSLSGQELRSPARRDSYYVRAPVSIENGRKRSADGSITSDVVPSCSGLMLTGRMFGSMVKGREPPMQSIKDQSQLSPEYQSQLNPQPSAQIVRDLDYIDPSAEFLQMPTTTAEKLFKGYFKHIATRWPILHSMEIRDMHSRRLQLRDCFEISSMSLVYAIGGRFLETTGEAGKFFPERHYKVAMDYLDKLLQTQDMRAVQTLLLHAVYCLRAPRRPGAWTYIGLATRMCIELGYHRCTPPTFRPKLLAEMRRRLFWSCYCLDRQVSIILGRPFAISDRDINAELPWDINESATEKELDAFKPGPKQKSTSMSLFIHLTKLRRIESAIQQSAYRVDKQATLPAIVIDRFLEELEEWKSRIPLDNRLDDVENAEELAEMSTFDGSNYYLTYYYEIIRNLLYPQLTATNRRVLVKCAEACGGVCKTYQQLLRQAAVGFSLMALYSVFLAGLTLIYCIWQDPVAVFSISANNDLNACSIVLYVITERWPGARKYRHAFETIKQCIMELLGDGELQPRKPLTGLDANLRATLKDVQNLHPEGKQDFGRMVSDMLESHSATNTPAAPIVEMQLSPLSGQAPTPLGYSAVFNMQPAYGVDTPDFQDATGFLDSSMQMQMQMQMQTQVPNAMDMMDGFDMEEFLSNPNSFWEPMILP